MPEFICRAASPIKRERIRKGHISIRRRNIDWRGLATSFCPPISAHVSAHDFICNENERKDYDADDQRKNYKAPINFDDHFVSSNR